jgi:hypothetical protein
MQCFELVQYAKVQEDAAVRRFIENYLRSDGIFVIRMLTLHSGVIFGTDLVQELWKNYFGIEEHIHRSSSFPKLAFPMGEFFKHLIRS